MYSISFVDVHHTDWICGKLEDMLGSVIQGISEEDEIVVVLDPPRAGVHSEVVRTIRSHPRIHRLIYVSCHPEAALQNWIE
jgi:tRNA (uracil-5-)-methyltransferase